MNIKRLLELEQPSLKKIRESVNNFKIADLGSGEIVSQLNKGVYIDIFVNWCL